MGAPAPFVLSGSGQRGTEAGAAASQRSGGVHPEP